MRTIKEIAVQVGKSKTTISQKIDELGLRTSLQKVSNKYLVPDDVAERIISSFTDQPQTEVQPVDTEIRNEYIDFLRSELKSKNDQIEQLQKLLDQEQQLRLMADQKILMLEAKAEEKQVEQPKWWQFWK